MSKNERSKWLAAIVLVLWVLALSYLSRADAQDLREQSSVETRCVALVVFSESRGESYLGQAAVAGTVVGRSQRLSVDTCAIVSASGQYVLPRDPWLTDKNAWAKAVDVAESVMIGSYDLATCAGATHFHKVGEHPYWSKKFTFVCQVGGHLFYRE